MRMTICKEVKGSLKSTNGNDNVFLLEDVR